MMKFTDTDITEALKDLHEWEKFFTVMERPKGATKAKKISDLIKSLTGRR